MSRGIWKDTKIFRLLSSIFLWNISTLTKSIRLWNDVDQWINIDKGWWIYYLYGRGLVKLGGTSADSRKCQLRGPDVSTNARYVLENVSIFWKADRTGLDIDPIHLTPTNLSFQIIFEVARQVYPPWMLLLRQNLNVQLYDGFALKSVCHNGVLIPQCCLGCKGSWEGKIPAERSQKLQMKHIFT